MKILKNRTVLGIICITMSLIICFGLTPLFNGAVKAQTEIVHITKDVGRGALITPDMVSVVSVGTHNLPDNIIKDMNLIIGRYAKADLFRGDYILMGKLSDFPLTEFEYLNELNGEKQAMSVTIGSFAAGLSGKLEAGDIITLIAVNFGDDRETIMPPELQYVRVLAATDNRGNDKEFNDKPDDEERQLPTTVTLLVSPRQALLLAELEHNSRLHSALVYRGNDNNAAKFLEIQDVYLERLDEDEAEEDHETEEAEIIGAEEITDE